MGHFNYATHCPLRSDAHRPNLLILRRYQSTEPGAAVYRLARPALLASGYYGQYGKVTSSPNPC